MIKNYCLLVFAILLNVQSAIATLKLVDVDNSNNRPESHSSVSGYNNGVPYTYLKPAQLGPSPKDYLVVKEVKEQHEQIFEQHSVVEKRFLDQIKLVILIDHSSSQTYPAHHPFNVYQNYGMLGNRWSQWDSVYLAVQYLAEFIFENEKRAEKVPLIFFGNKAQEVLVSNREEMLESFLQHNPNKEGTNLLDGIKLGTANYAQNGRPTLFVVLTDGMPNGHQTGQQQENNMIHQVIYNEFALKDHYGSLFKFLFLGVGDDESAWSFLNGLQNDQYLNNSVLTYPMDAIFQMGPKNLIIEASESMINRAY